MGADDRGCIDPLVLLKFFIAFSFTNRVIFIKSFLDLFEQPNEAVELLEELSIQLQAVGLL